MNEEKSIVKMLEEKGRIGLVELAALFLPPPPIRVWEEEFEAKNAMKNAKIAIGRMKKNGEE